VVGESWSVDEILDAAALDELEGAGQSKRMTARICAEVHNAVRMYAWGRSAKPGDKPPVPITESQFLPVRVQSKDKVELAEGNRKAVDKQLNDWASALCGL